MVTVTKAPEHLYCLGDTVFFGLQVSDADGSKLTTKFFAGLDVVKTDTIAEPMMQWVAQSPGNYKIFAEITDSNGYVARTNEYPVTVKAAFCHRV
ncbi:MAG: hypothetical protein HC896_09765 [Bacteroidales bacterium]|nr:hypothetical protein [Bacteroidales bacterium]